jgi:hypothetical protein
VTEPRVYVLKTSGLREIPVSYARERREIPGPEHAREIGPGVRIAFLGSGDYLMPDGSVEWGAQIAVWNEPGTRTEWAARFDTGPRGYQHAQPYVTEDDAREAVAEVAQLAPDQNPILMSRTVGPWKEVPDA